jgi:hypothetical protein
MMDTEKEIIMNNSKTKEENMDAHQQTLHEGKKLTTQAVMHVQSAMNGQGVKGSEHE